MAEAKTWNFDRIIERRGTGSVKWDAADRLFGAQDVLPMWVADMDFASPLPVVEALRRRLDHRVFGYQVDDPESAFEAVADWLLRRQGWKVETSWLSTTAGVVSALRVAVAAFTKPGEGVIIQPPVYHPFFECAGSDRCLLQNPLRETPEGDYRMDLEDLEQKARDARMLVLCNPHNPVGRVWSREELAAVAEIAARHDLFVVSDEIHSDLIFGGRSHIPYASLDGANPSRTAVLLAPSKTFNLAGLDTSLAVLSDDSARRRFRETQRSLGAGKANLLGVTAMEAAYREGEPWLTALLEYLEGNARYLCEFVSARLPGVRVREPEGTYLAWLDCRGLGLDDTALETFFSRQARVGINRGSMFGTSGQGHMRLNFGTPKSFLQQGLERIECAMK